MTTKHDSAIDSMELHAHLVLPLDEGGWTITRVWDGWIYEKPGIAIYIPQQHKDARYIFKRE